MDWEIYGHEWAADLLKRHITYEQVRHAYLFTGPEGIGRRTLALRFARALNCPQPIAPGQACGICPTCRQIDRQQHPDLTIVQAENDGGVLKVEQIRDLQHKLALAPYAARYRIALLLRFQEANANAQNALLKTLEEAPEKVVLLLTADSAETLLPTIVSRCEILRLRPLALDKLNQALQERWHLSAEKASMLAHLSGGRMGYALFLNDHPELLSRRQEWTAEIPYLLHARRRERFAYAESAAKDKDALRQLFQVWLSYWRDLLLVSSGAHTPLIHLNETSQLQELAGEIDPQTARICTTRLEQALQQLDANINARLVTEIVLLDWPRL